MKDFLQNVLAGIIFAFAIAVIVCIIVGIITIGIESIIRFCPWAWSLFSNFMCSIFC